MFERQLKVKWSDEKFEIEVRTGTEEDAIIVTELDADGRAMNKIQMDLTGNDLMNIRDMLLEAVPRTL